MVEAARGHRRGAGRVARDERRLRDQQPGGGDLAVDRLSGRIEPRGRLLGHQGADAQVQRHRGGHPCRDRVAHRHRPLGRGDALVELLEIEPVGDERVASVMPGDAIRAERAAQSTHQHTDLLVRLARQVVSPQELGERVHPHRRAPSDRERGEERARLATPHLAGRPSLDRQAPQKPHPKLTHGRSVEVRVDVWWC